MSQRRFRPLTGADLGALPAPCATCPFGAPPTGDSAVVRAAIREFGLCGVAAYRDDRVIGYLLVAEAAHLPPGHPLEGCAGDRVAVLVRARVVEGERRAGVGRQLVAALVSHLAQQGVRGLESLGGLPTPTCGAPPVEWLESAGFAPVVDGAPPRWRLDIAGTQAWRDQVGGALRRLRGLMPKPIAAPEPTTRGAGPVRVGR